MPEIDKGGKSPPGREHSVSLPTPVSENIPSLWRLSVGSSFSDWWRQQLVTPAPGSSKAQGYGSHTLWEQATLKPGWMVPQSCAVHRPGAWAWKPDAGKNGFSPHWWPKRTMISLKSKMFNIFTWDDFFSLTGFQRKLGSYFHKQENVKIRGSLLNVTQNKCNLRVKRLPSQPYWMLKIAGNYRSSIIWYTYRKTNQRNRTESRNRPIMYLGI